MGGSERLSRGFTLVETLAVMGITLTLAALVGPFLARVKGNTRATTCASQLKQIVTGTIDYTVHHRVYPVYGLWPAKHDAGTEVYAVAERADHSGWSRFDRRVLLCPSDEQPSVLPIENAQGKIEWWLISYGFNIALGSRGTRPSSLSNPAQTLFFYDGDPTGLVADPDVDGGIKVKNNNGHGNNEDGVDSSNPGKGGKKIDTSTWDDDIMASSARSPTWSAGRVRQRARLRRSDVPQAPRGAPAHRQRGLCRRSRRSPRQLRRPAHSAVRQSG